MPAPNSSTPAHSHRRSWATSGSALAPPLLVSLTAGTYAFTMRNRESDYLGAMAGIAELVLTNDPDWEP